MGSIAYDYLTNSGLLDDHLLETGLRDISDNRLIDLIEGYHSHVLSSKDTLHAELHASKSPVRLYLSKEKLDVELLKQASLYVPQFVIEDPLFALKPVDHPVSTTGNKALGLETGLNRAAILKLLTELRAITPMIEHDYVKLVPAAIERPASELPVLYTDNQFQDGLPASVLDFFHSHTSVLSIKSGGSGIALNHVERLISLLVITRRSFPSSFSHPDSHPLMILIFGTSFRLFLMSHLPMIILRNGSRNP